MAINLQVDFKTPVGVTAPSGTYLRPGLAIANIAIALTKNKLLVEATGAKEDPGLRATLKAVRDISNYRHTDGGWVYEDGNILVAMQREATWIKREQPQVWVDSDGVAANFDAQVEKITGKTIKELGDDKMWELCGSNQEFWDTMPIMPEFERLWAVLKPLNPIILTGCPKTAYDLSSERKKAWWKKNFDQDEVVTVLSKDKAQFIEVSGDVLIDDFYVNIKRWREAGGIGILHRSVDETIAQIERMKVL